MTRYRVRPKYAILDDLPPDAEAVVVSPEQLAELVADGIPRPFEIGLTGTPVLVNNGRLLTSARSKVTTGGRPPGRDLAKRGKDLLRQRAALGETITQEKLAEKLGVQPVTVRRYFRGGYWVPFRATGALPPAR